MAEYTVTDEMIVAARDAICERQQSLVAKITKSSIRDALITAEATRLAELVCPQCRKAGGPYPRGDRPEGHYLRSGCSRCGWCY